MVNCKPLRKRWSIEFTRISRFEEGEVIVFVTDMPYMPSQYTQVMIVQAGTEGKGAAKVNRTLGVCHVIENQRLPSGEPRVSAINSIDPIGWVKLYFSTDEHRQIDGPGRASVLQNPAHGVFRSYDQGDYLYIPALGYLGKDRGVMLVEMGGMKIRIVYTVHVVDMVNQDTEGLCPPGNARKISLSPDADLLASQDPAKK